MSDRPILFSGPMVRALLAGRKTQTRRVLHDGYVYDDIASEALEDFELRGYLPFTRGETMNAAKVPFAAGDRLWVREAWCWAALGGYDARDDGGEVWYRASDEGECDGPWKPSIHMPRTCSRLTLTVTDVRVQLLNDISEADARAEGFPISSAGALYDPPPPSIDNWQGYARASFFLTWNELNGPRGYGVGANPWVAAVSFEVQNGNIDALKTRDAA